MHYSKEKQVFPLPGPDCCSIWCYMFAFCFLSYLLASPKLLSLGIVKVNFFSALAYSQLSLFSVLCNLFSVICTPFSTKIVKMIPFLQMLKKDFQAI